MNEAIAKLVTAEADLYTDLALAHEGAVGLIVEATKLQQENAQLLIALANASGVVVDPPDPTPSGIAEPSTVSLLANPAQEHQGWGDTIFFPKTQTQSTLKDLVVICGGRSGFINNKTLPFNIDWSNLTFLQGPYPVGWGAAMNKVSGKMVGCKFIGLGRRDWTKSQNFVDGHPTYFKPWDDVSFEDNYFIQCGGNAQFADRPWENEVPERLKLTFERNVWSNSSWNPTGHGGGGSFNLAVYCATNQGTSVNIKDCIWTNTITWIDVANAKVNASARGCLALWNEAFYPKQKWIDAGFPPDLKKHFSKVVVEDCTVRTTYPDRELFSFEGTREIVFKGLKLDFIDLPDGLDRPVILIDKNPDNAQQAKYISISPIDAPGFMRIKGVDYLLTEGYEYLEDGYTPIA